MGKCKYCGDHVDYRWIDGQVVPIHANRSCGGRSYSHIDLGNRPSAALSFNYFVNPNAKCPVCKEKVFYYENEHGSKVYFDHLGPPWPKHSCTDQAAQQSKKSFSAYRMPSKNALKKSPPFFWDDSWHPYLVFSIDYLEEYKYPYFSVSGFIYGTRFAVIISPLKQYSFKLDAPFFIRRIDDITFEVSTILEHKNMIDYQVLAFVRPQDALRRRSRNKKLERLKRIYVEPSSSNRDSLSSKKKLVTKKATSTFPKTSRGVCHSCSRPIILLSTDKKSPIKMEHLEMPWTKHRCWEDRQNPEANSWNKAFLQHVSQNKEGKLLITVKCEAGTEYRLGCEQPDIRLNKNLPLCLRIDSSDQITLSTITTCEGKKLHQHFWECSILSS